MNFVTPNKEEINPFLQLLLLLVYGIIGAVVFGLIGLAITFAMYGTALFSNLDILLTGDPRLIDGFKVIQIFSSIGTFVLPGIALA